MTEASRRAIAIVGLGAILPDATDVASFWANVKGGRYSIREVPPGRWDPALYFDPDPHAPEKTYSKIGGWVMEAPWDPLKWKLPIPPKVAEAMDEAQQWTIACVREALADYGHPGRKLDLDRTAVILGNAMAGEKHYLTALRVFAPEFTEALATAPSFAGLPANLRQAIAKEGREALLARLPGITEDTMPGELANCIAGRVANLLNLHGPNFVTDAACASALAAMDAAADGLLADEYDAVLVGGVDRNMGAPTFVKFCKIGALSATGTRPYADGADGFVMGEGGAMFLMKRLVDAERDGDRIYAVLRGVGGASDGRGKGITAPNPVGQKLAVERAWKAAGLSPATATLFEGHGTSTRVGDVVEVESLAEVLLAAGAAPGSIALGSVKSNIGHLKGAAGAAGVLKAVLSLHEKVMPPSLHCEKPNPNIDFSRSPLFVNTALRPWEKTVDGVRRMGVSAFGFGGTNFHAVLEEYVPGRITSEGKRTISVPAAISSAGTPVAASPPPSYEHVVLLGAVVEASLVARLEALQREAAAGRVPSADPPPAETLRAPLRIALQFANAAELAQKADRARKALALDQPAAWKALRAQGVFRGNGEPSKIAFLYTGQGSQYPNMLRTLRETEPEVRDTFAEADRVMTPLLGHPLSDLVFPDPNDAEAVKRAEDDLRRTEITQPAVLATDIALTRLLARFGIRPDFVMGHSLGEYAALVAAGSLPFEDALVAVSARGRAMASLDMEDNGWMAAVFAPLAEIERVLQGVSGHVEIANLNSRSQAVIGGASEAVERAMAAFQAAGIDAIRLPVSHAFHTAIVAPVSEPLRETLAELRLSPPQLPIVSNVTGDFYPTGDVLPQMLDLLGRQVASPVQFVKGLETLYSAGARLFVEVGPKKALHGFVEDVLGAHPDVLALFTNHPKQGDEASFRQALAGLLASGHGGAAPATAALPSPARPEPVAAAPRAAQPAASASPGENARYAQLGRLFASFLEQSRELFQGSSRPADGLRIDVTGAALGLPGAPRVFDDGNIARLLRGEQGIDVIPTPLRQAMLAKHITRLVKRPEGTPSFDLIDDPDDVIRLAARGGAFDLGAEFGVSEERLPALDVVTRLAMAAGLDALRDAGIPLVRRYRQTTKGGWLPEGYALPESMRDDTGIIFGAAFPGLDSFADETARWQQERARREEIGILQGVRARAVEPGGGSDVLVTEIDRRIHDLEAALAAEPYAFDRRFLFRVLAMGHSQLAEWIGARGPNTHVNTACASTTHAVSLAEDWIRAGRCRRVLIVAADDVTSDHLLEWMGAGFLASGAAATDDVVEDAAIPFDRRRHGMILGMGAAALVVEREDSAAERGIAPIAELLASETANSAFHGTRLDVDHIAQVMERLFQKAEARAGLDRHAMASQTLFVSHETYTPARGGSAAAEVHALRHIFGAAAEQVVVANTKGFTGHPMGAGIEDVVAVKSLETGVVPPVANLREPDPELGTLHLSKGGSYDIEYALRLGAGFGSQIAMTLLRRVPPPGGVRPAPDALGYEHRIVDRNVWLAWLEHVSGHPGAVVEVEKRTLRIRDQGPPRADAARPAAPAPAAVPRPIVEPPAPSPMAAAPVAAVAAAKASPVAAPPEPALAPPAGSDEIQQRVLALVAEKTGYPQDMLSLDLDLEADLGIDTVKQAEVFATVREAYGIARDDKLRLRDFPTLAHVIGFVRDRSPGLGAAPAPEATPAATEVKPEPPVASSLAGFEAAELVPRRVPVARLRLPAALFAKTGVALAKGDRVIVARDGGGVAKALEAALDKRGVKVLPLGADEDVESVGPILAGWLAEGGVAGVYWLPALDAAPQAETQDIAAWRTALRLRVKRLYTTMRSLAQNPGAMPPFLVSATRLGGEHGYDAGGACDVLGGGVTGFTKAWKRETPAALAKAVDFEPAAAAKSVASALLEETLRDGGAVEIGRRDGLRFCVGLEEQPVADGGEGLALGPESVFVVTGAAGSIVSAIIADLAAASGGTFHLLDRVAEPAVDDPDLERFVSDRDGLKRDLFERLRARGERATPALVERELAGLERSRAALDAMIAVRSAGGTVHWHAVDLLDAGATAKAVAEIRESAPVVEVVLHAAGLEVSRLLADKEPAEFDRVFDVKSEGWFQLVSGLSGHPVRAFVAFSSIAGRFGNGGQTDYSAANDLLCKSVSALRRSRPELRAIALDWTGWARIGMASRGSIPKVLTEAGISLLPPEAGIPWVRRELVSGSTRGEVLVAGALGILGEPLDTDAGLDAVALAAALFVGPMLAGASIDVTPDRVTFRTRLDPALQPFLGDHRIEGTPVLPGVMGLEGFVEAASALAPGWRVVALEDVRFEAPFKFYRDAAREVTLRCTTRRDGESVLVDCVLLGERTLPGQPAPAVTEHFRARVRLSKEAAAQQRAAVPSAPSSEAVTADAIYRVYFHGPAYRVIDRAWREGPGSAALVRDDLPPNHAPAELPLLAAPRFIEACFQTAGLHEMAAHGRFALPQAIDSVVFAAPPGDGTGWRFVLATPDPEGQAFGASVVDASGRLLLRLRGYRTVTLPGGLDETLAAPIRKALGAGGEA